MMINIICQTSLSRMPKLFRNLLVLALIMRASCFDVTEDNVITTTEISTLTATSTYIDNTSMRTTITEENALATTSATVTTQDDGISKNLSHALPSSPSPPLPSPSPSSSSSSDTVWECPNITKAGVECSCDFPHTLRCTGDRTALQVIETTARRLSS